MATFSVGFFKATVLVGGTVLIGVLSFAAGAVLLQTPPADGDAVAGDSVAKAPASAESELLDTVIPDPLRSEMRGNVKVFGTRLGDAAGDQFVSGANAISDPVAKALESGSQALLPSFIADKVPWVTGHVRGSVINTGKSQVGGIFENAYGDALAGDIDLPGTDLLDGRAASAAVQTSEDEAIQRGGFHGGSAWPR